MQKYFYPSTHNKFEISIRWGHIGCSLPIAYGKYLSNREPSWVIAGDGGTLDGLGMLSFCINQQENGIDIPITMFIFVDGYYSAVVAGLEKLNLINDENVDNLTLEKDPYISSVKVPNINWEKMVPSDMLKIINNPSELNYFIKNTEISKKFQVILLKINKNEKLKNIMNSSIKEINFSKEMENALKNNQFDKVKKIPLVLVSEINN